jgi:predicted Rossmann fold flavoprotein
VAVDADGSIQEARWQAVVIGAGAAGLVAATELGARGLRTLLLEKNRRPGVKILMSGGTRCNLTQNTDSRGIIRAYGEQGKFLHSALAAFTPADVVRMVEEQGVPTKIEETGKIFPVSNQATDVLAALVRRLERSGAQLALEEPVREIRRVADGFEIVTPRRTLTADCVVLTTGGKSYPGSGTTGDGYQWAQALGHSLVPPRPALVPLRTQAAWLLELKGLTIPDVELRIVEKHTAGAGGTREAVLDKRRGSFLFTHFGMSGPVVLDISRAVTGHSSPQSLELVCDFLPGERADQFEGQLTQLAQQEGKKQLDSALALLLPRRLADALLAQANVAPTKRAAEVSREERKRIVCWVKEARVLLSGALGFEKAEVTAGGVPLAEVDSRTMQSKLVPGLYLAGEILDLDGPIGGYNFQAAFSTGVLAGRKLLLRDSSSAS